ncbi:MAG: Fe(3+) dicitrate transport protein [Flavobacteriales bacterium]|jgi:Fe(3+) dicitrate transport protein
MNKLIFILIFLIPVIGSSQFGRISGVIKDSLTGKPIPYCTVIIEPENQRYLTNEEGKFRTTKLNYGTYHVKIGTYGYSFYETSVVIDSKNKEISFLLQFKETMLAQAYVKAKSSYVGSIGRVKPIENVMITSGKKIEIIQMDAVSANKSINNARQIYSRIPGLNIWESDGAGIQLGIGGRGLSPSRTANYNTRQNGYDISADALGYPESYYNPPSEAIESIQFLKGASSLQFGPQFGGLINFKLKQGHKTREIAGSVKKTFGSFNMNSLFIEAGGTSGTWRYYGYFNRKTGNEWRPNSQYEVYNGGFRLEKFFTENTRLSIEVTKMYYLAHQPGGLTDLEFAQTPYISKRKRNWFEVDWNMWSINFLHEFNSTSKIESKFFGLVASRKSVGFLGQINRVDPLTERNLIRGAYNNVGNETRYLKLYNWNKQIQAFLIGARIYKGLSNNEQGFGSNGTDANFSLISDDNLPNSSYSFPSANLALFTENIFKPNEKLTIIPGIRFEYIKTEAQGTYNQVNFDLAGNALSNEIKEEELNNERSFIISGLGFNYQLKQDTIALYANISQNYRSINFTDMQIINPNLRIDPKLADERGFNSDIGIKGHWGSAIYADASIYALYYSNRIGTVIQKDSVLFNTFQYRTNISKSLTLGFEGILQIDFLKLSEKAPKNKSLIGFLNYSYSFAKYLNDESFLTGNYVELVPPVNYKTGIDYSYNSFSIAYQFSWTHWQYSDASNSLSQANAVNGIIPTYHVMDLSIKYTIDELELNAGINNLSNQIYFTRRAVSYPGPGIITSAPRSLYFGFSVNF